MILYCSTYFDISPPSGRARAGEGIISNMCWEVWFVICLVLLLFSQLSGLDRSENLVSIPVYYVETTFGFMPFTFTIGTIGTLMMEAILIGLMIIFL